MNFERDATRLIITSCEVEGILLVYEAPQVEMNCDRGEGLVKEYEEEMLIQRVILCKLSWEGNVGQEGSV